MKKMLKRIDQWNRKPVKKTSEARTVLFEKVDEITKLQYNQTD